MITGANGFIGSHLALRLRSLGYQIIECKRDPINDEDRPYQLGNPISIKKDENPDWIIHLAYSDQDSNQLIDKNINFIGARTLINQARELGAKFMYVSSMSAHADAESSYGQVKWAIESLLDSSTDVIVRPGFVIGDGGIFLRLSNQLKKLPMIPLFYSSRLPIQPVCVSDLSTAIYQILEKDLRGVFNIALPKSIEIKNFYRKILERTGQKKFFFVVPGWMAEIIFGMIDWMPFKIPFSKENLHGLKHLKHFETDSDLKKIGVSIKTLDELFTRKSN